MRPLPLAILAMLFTLSMTVPPALAQPSGVDISLDVVVTRDGDLWVAEFEFAREAPVQVFARSGLTRNNPRSPRLEAWTVETPGVRIARRGHHDVFEPIDGAALPRRVRVGFVPFAEDMRAAYEPALTFTGGAVALFTDQFDAFPMDSLEAAEALPMDLNGVETGPSTARVTYRDMAGPVLFRGERHAELTVAGGQGYVVFGDAEVLETDHLAAVVDPGLPGWIRTELADFTPLLLDLYAAELGPGDGRKPTIMVSWAGPTEGLRSMGGSVLPGLIIMTFEGAGVVDPTPAVRDAARWFIAHEAAHFWLGQVVRYERVRDMWITEGGADLLAVRALQRLDPDYDGLAVLQRGVDDCIRLAGQPVAGAAERGEHQAYYACGAVFGLVAEAASGDDVFGFLRPLIDANREDGVLTADEWLAELTRRSGDAFLAAGIEQMLEQGVADPAAAVATLFQRAGVAFTRDEAGGVRLGRPLPLLQRVEDARDEDLLRIKAIAHDISVAAKADDPFPQVAGDGCSGFRIVRQRP